MGKYSKGKVWAIWLIKSSVIVLLMIVAVRLLITFQKASRPSWRISVVEIYPLGVGGGGLCGPHFYDVAGKGYPDLSSYQGEAPVYALPYDILKKLPSDPNGCPVYPDVVSPETISAEGIAIYPLKVDVGIKGEAKWMQKGESAILEVKGVIKRSFTQAYDYLVSINPGERVKFVFRLDAPNFNVSPRGETSAFLSIGYPMIKEWAIAPNEDTLGTQHMVLEVDSERIYFITAPLDVKVEVREASWSTPRLTRAVGEISALLVILTGIVSLVRSTAELWKKIGYKLQKEPHRRSRRK